MRVAKSRRWAIVSKKTREGTRDRDHRVSITPTLDDDTFRSSQTDRGAASAPADVGTAQTCSDAGEVGQDPGFRPTSQAGCRLLAGRWCCLHWPTTSLASLIDASLQPTPNVLCYKTQKCLSCRPIRACCICRSAAGAMQLWIAGPGHLANVDAAPPSVSVTSCSCHPASLSNRAGRFPAGRGLLLIVDSVDQTGLSGSFSRAVDTGEIRPFSG